MQCLIGYELIASDKDRQPFLSELQARSRRLLPTTWITTKPCTKEELMRTLWPLLDQKDRLVIAEVPLAAVVGANLLA